MVPETCHGYVARDSHLLTALQFKFLQELTYYSDLKHTFVC